MAVHHSVFVSCLLQWGRQERKTTGDLVDSPLDIEAVAALMKYTEEVPPVKGKDQPQLYALLNGACYNSDRSQVRPCQSSTEN